ncbi:hypothetical protein Tco_0983007 [Tanacetum coccineum]
MSTLAEYMIVVGAENRPSMLDKTMYNSWQIRMLLYLKGKKNDRLAIESIKNGPLVYPTIKENGLLPDVYALVNHYQAAKDIWDRVTLLMQGTEISYQEHECKLYNEFDKFTSIKGLAVPVFLLRDDPIACLNKATTFMSTIVASHFSSTNNQLRTSSNPRNQTTIQDSKAQEDGQVLDEKQLAFLADPGIPYGQAIQTTILQNAAFQTDDLDAYDSDCDYISSAKAVLMANLSSYDSDILSEYLQQTQSTIVQDTNSFAQQDAMILSMIEQMSNQVTNYNKIDLENKRVNESLTTKLEKYKERVKTFEQRLNIDLNSREKLIDSQMDDMIWDRCALKKEIDSLKQTLSKQIKEKES